MFLKKRRIRHALCWNYSLIQVFQLRCLVDSTGCSLPVEAIRVRQIPKFLLSAYCEDFFLFLIFLSYFLFPSLCFLSLSFLPPDCFNYSSNIVLLWFVTFRSARCWHLIATHLSPSVHLLWTTFRCLLCYFLPFSLLTTFLPLVAWCMRGYARLPRLWTEEVRVSESKKKKRRKNRVKEWKSKCRMEEVHFLWNSIEPWEGRCCEKSCSNYIYLKITSLVTCAQVKCRSLWCIFHWEICIGSYFLTKEPSLITCN